MTSVIPEVPIQQNLISLMQIKVNYLQMTAPPTVASPPPRDGLVIAKIHKPALADFRYWYEAVGRDYHWLGRSRQTDAELIDIIHHELFDFYTMHVDNAPAGFASLDRRQNGEVQLKQIGLLPPYLGQGLGKYLLHWMLDKAWSYRPRRVWLHTCSLDHPAALPMYFKAGFVVYQEAIVQRNL